MAVRNKMGWSSAKGRPYRGRTLNDDAAQPVIEIMAVGHDGRIHSVQDLVKEGSHTSSTLEKIIIISFGARDSVQSRKMADAVLGDLTEITGRRPVRGRGKKSIVRHKIRETMPLGTKMTLRGQQMDELLDRLRQASGQPVEIHPPSTMIEYGAARIERGTHSAEVLSQNKELGRQALQRAIPVLTSSGVSIPITAGTPLYHADPQDPGRLIRVIDGRQERGQFKGKDFIVEG
jgi:hypothetical protein